MITFEGNQSISVKFIEKNIERKSIISNIMSYVLSI